MNAPKYPTSRRSTPGLPEPKRRSILADIGIVVVMLMVATIGFKSLKKSTESTGSTPVTVAPEAKGQPVRETMAVRDAAPHDAATSPATVEAAPPQKTLSLNPLVAELMELSGTHGPITPAQAERFKQILAALVQQGAASVPAIQELLKQGMDYRYIDVSGGDQLGFPSLRASLFDVLKQIGGPEAQAAMLQTLQTTASPAEVLELAKNLEMVAPGLYSDQIQKTARDALNTAMANQAANVEIGPIFHLLQMYGANTIADASKVDPNGFYNAVAMANQPNGQGLPSLIQMAQNSSGSSQSIATEMIAQLASQNSQALNTLVQMAQNGQIPNNIWMRLAPILGGDQYQLASGAAQNASSASANTGDQNYAIVNTATTADQINQRIAMIQNLLSYVPQDSAGANALRHELDVLGGKLGQ
jgi:hypothetical protein